MKSLFAAVAVVLLLASTASAGWAYVAPGPVVYGAYYGGPVYAYPGVTPVVVARPVMAAPAPVVYAPAPVAYPAVVGYGYPYVVRAKYYVPGQPVRNAVRAVLP